MIFTTTDIKREYTILGVVQGSTIRARGIGFDITAGLRSIFGGEVPEYSKLLKDSRAEAMERLEQEARRLGADAVVGVRFTSSAVLQGASEILAFGTAVKFK
ncbi:MAG: YbjQ family protein [bacterium]|nr:YbjQ family protein [bacterium]